MSSVSTVKVFFHRPPFLPASGAFTKSLHVCILFQTCFAAYKHTRISAKAQLFLHLPKGFLKGRTVQCKYVALFLLYFIFKMKNRSRGTAFTSTKQTLISLFWLQEAQEPCLSIESPAKTVRRLIHVFTGYTGKCRKSCALALYVCAYAAKHV